MKKTLLAALLPAMLVAGTAQAATVYQAEDGSQVDVFGRLGFSMTNRTGGDNADGNARGRFDNRLGFGGAQTINDQMSVIGWAEYQIGAAEGANAGNDSFTARYVWAGVDMGNIGKVTFGRVASGLIMATDIADVFAASDVNLASQASVINSNATQVFRQDDTLQYQGTFGDLDVSAAYIIGNDRLKNGYNVAARYTFDMGNAGKLAPVVGYQRNTAEDNVKDAAQQNLDKNDFWTIGTRYYFNDLMLGAVYSEDKLSYKGNSDATKDKGYELTAVYDFQNDWVVRGGYRDYKAKTGSTTDRTMKDWTAEVQYKLTDRSSIFTSYVKRDGEDKSKASNAKYDLNQDYYHLGLRYEF
ncbi:hypothetical protein A3K86_07190 [Photobacterium jeanii]|uniref:Porin domain-containing protein n=1 Tax=Photobacterium jeanii TaxID=858640 RepID=A0A178KPR9_9GAMM|nr:porin [Photobacterium jeanii]OAN18663.1 hypothetical protein A3K86_07190 [Photobacterium jeanii]PST91657.1 porin [Photobacterium jeanii]